MRSEQRIVLLETGILTRVEIEQMLANWDDLILRVWPKTVREKTMVWN